MLTTFLGLIVSPGFPSNYANDLDCKWVIIVEEGFQIDLDFAYFEVDPDPLEQLIFLIHECLPLPVPVLIRFTRQMLSMYTMGTTLTHLRLQN